MPSLKTSGQGNSNAKLTAEQVKFIKLARYYGARVDLLAKHYRISPTQVYRIVMNMDWRRV